MRLRASRPQLKRGPLGGAPDTGALSNVSWLFAPPPEPRSAWSIIRWWEARRVPYNLIVGTVGLLSFVAFLALVGYCGHLEPGEDAFEPLELFIAPIAINLCYTAGWVTEISLWRAQTWGRPIGPRLLRLGLAFSLIVVMLPAILWAVTCDARAVGG